MTLMLLVLPAVLAALLLAILLKLCSIDRKLAQLVDQCGLSPKKELKSFDKPEGDSPSNDDDTKP